MDPDLESAYTKMCKKRKKTPITYKDKLGKTVKTSPGHNFNLGA
jgi:hypothetical protein